MAEVALLDSYTIQDSARRSALVERLRSLAQARHDEFSDSQLSTWLWSGALIILPDIRDWDDITETMAHGITLWSSLAILDARMLTLARYFPIDSRVGKTDPSRGLEAAVNLKKELLKQWTLWCEQTGMLEDEIIQGTMYRRDWRTDLVVPASTQESPAQQVLTLHSTGTDFAIVQWTQARESDFYSYRVYRSTTAGLLDITRMAAETNPGVREDATLAYEMFDLVDCALKITSLPAGTHYFVLVVADVNGRVSVSDELTVTI